METDNYQGLLFSRLEKEDVPLLQEIMKRSFDADSKLYFNRDEGGPEGYDDGTFLLKWAFSSNATAYKVAMNGKVIGAFILFLNYEKKQGYLGCIFLDADQCGKGIGTTVWHYIEKTYSQIENWFTETPAVSFRNHCFYVNKCGFQIYEVTDPNDRFEAQFKLKKNKR